MHNNNDLICPYCASKAKIIFTALDLNNRVDDRPFHYGKCERCGLIFITEIPRNLASYYKSDYAPYQRPASKIELEKDVSTVKHRLDLLNRFIISGKMLEIGPSFGAFAFLAKQSGFEVDVIEMDRASCDFMESELGLKVYETQDVLSTLKGLKTYDAIALWHNIEHLSNPWTVLKELCEHLNPNGVIILSTPNPDSWQFRFLGRFWAHLDAPRHLYLLPRKFFELCLADKKNFVLKIETDDVESLNLTRWGWSASLKNIAGNQRGNVKFFLAQLFGRVLSLLFLTFEQGPRSAAHTVILKRRIVP